MSLADGIVIEIVTRSDLDAACTEFRIHIVIGDHRDVASGKRKPHSLTHVLRISLVFRIHRHRNIAQHGFRARRSHRQAEAITWIADFPDAAVFFFAVDLQVGYRGTQIRIPVHQTLATIDQSFLVHPHKYFDDRARHLRVHREVTALLAFGVGKSPVARHAEAAHLPGDGRPRLLLPFPDAFDEFFAPQVVPGLAFELQLALDHDLRCDTGVVRTDHPVGGKAAHAVVADQCIHQGLLECMAHVQGAGNIRRRKLDAVRRIFFVAAYFEIAARFPDRVPAPLNVLRLEAFCEFHGSTEKKVSGEK